jgi:TonB-linked SusC/RagA family outer membrane protein
MKKIYQRLLLVCCMMLSVAALAQQPGRTITGNVKDEKSEPLPGVSVMVSGTTTGVMTDVNGNYSLKVNGNVTLSFSFIGYITKDVETGSGNTLNVSLLPDAKQLKDVVVIGYGTASKKDVTGAITTIKAEDFNAGVTTTPAELLQGKVAGLNITRSDDPNKAPTVILRGASTFREGSAQEPFYVIDGVPGASIDVVAPADIENIDVLKDAASTAIYGSRAANGVIMVTTKKAKIGQTRLAYSGYAGITSVSKKIDMLTGDELRKYLADNKVPALANPKDDDGSNTDWQSLVERRGYSQNHNLSYGGAGKNSDYGASVNYFKNDGVLKRTSLQRIIYRGYINQRFFNDRLKLGLNVTNTNSDVNDIYQANVLPGMLFYLPTVSPYNPDGSYKENFQRTGSGTLNPLSLLNNNTIKTSDSKTLINGIAQLDIIDGLRFTFSGSVQRNQNNYNSYQNSLSGLAIGLNGVAKRQSYLNTNNIFESYFNYDKDFGKHSLKLLAGYSYQQNRTSDGFGVQTQGFSNDEVTYNNLALSNPSQLSQIVFDPDKPISTLRLISFYGRAQYQFDDKYLLQASLREDGSSAFGLNTRHGLFPAVSAGWRIIGEDFMQKVPVISDLKLRVGYGVSGNSLGFDPFTPLLIYGSNNSKFLYNGNIINAIGPKQNPNPDLKWESTGTLNVGIDFGLFQNRLTGSFDYYDKRTSNLIYTQYPVSLTQYFQPTITANAGNIKNTGVELSLTAVAVRSGSFNWKTSFNISHNTNVVESLSKDIYNLPAFYTAQLGGKGQSGNFSQIVQPGQSIGTFYLWHYLGKNATGLSTYQNAAGATIATQPLTTDQKIAGNAQPKMIYGWSNTFTYKKFDLNFLVRAVTGNKILNATLANLNNPTDSKLQNIPRFTLNEAFTDVNGYLISDRFLESGSYLRMDNATLGYTIKTQTSAFKAIRLYVTGNNLFVITKYRGVDPEVNLGGLTPGIDNNNFYPKTRTFLLGLNASF